MDNLERFGETRTVMTHNFNIGKSTLTLLVEMVDLS